MKYFVVNCTMNKEGKIKFDNGSYIMAKITKQILSLSDEEIGDDASTKVALKRKIENNCEAKIVSFDNIKELTEKEYLEITN